jgi:tetratricopeptide (TPR) repeat protein
MPQLMPRLSMPQQGNDYRPPSGSNSSICVPLETGWAIAAFTCITLLCAALIILETVDIAGSQVLAASMRLKNLTRAVALWPGNPEFHYRISTLTYNPIGQQDSAEALRQARLATELGPLWVRYWGQLVWACESAGDSQCADRAIERIRGLAPMDPEAVSLTANYYLLSNRPALALEQFRHLLRIAPSYGRDVFRICDSAGYPTAQLEQAFIDAGPQVLIAYISYLAERGKLDTARQLWSDLVRKAGASDFPLTLALVAPYIDRLLQLGDGQELQNVRLDLEKLKVLPSQSGVDGNLVFNGDFEQQPSSEGFDWRKPEARYPIIDFAADNAHNGKHCMRVDFTVGRNDMYVLVYQWLPLQPNSRYRLSAYVRSESITSDSGPRLHIYDPLCQACLDATSESTVGTTPWHEIRLEFSTGPSTQLGRLEVVRWPGRIFPRDITGVFWLDKVSLKAEPGELQTQGDR